MNSCGPCLPSSTRSVAEALRNPMHAVAHMKRGEVFTTGVIAKVDVRFSDTSTTYGAEKSANGRFRLRIREDGLGRSPMTRLQGARTHRSLRVHGERSEESHRTIRRIDLPELGSLYCPGQVLRRSSWKPARYSSGPMESGKPCTKDEAPTEKAAA